MDIELEKLKKLEHALHDAIDILRDWQVEEVKPEEERFIAYLARPKYRDCYLTACAEGMWEAVQKEFDAKTKLFVGTCDEAVKWYESREKFTEIIKAWEDGNELQFRPRDPHLSWQECQNPSWDSNFEYRVKPECPCKDGIDSKACVGCEHSEDGKPHPFENYHCYVCDKSSKKEYKPYETVHEFIQDFQERFPTAVPRPAHTMPLIWLKGKATDKRSLVIGIPPKENKIYVDGGRCDLLSLFTLYTYLDGSPVGMEIKK